jgi:ribosomal protein S18 acetylase RimI-like enzyme
MTRSNNWKERASFLQPRFPFCRGGTIGRETRVKSIEGGREHVRVRVASEADYEVICQIGDLDDADARLLSLHLLIQRGECLVSEAGSEIVGFAVLERQRFFGRDFVSLLRVAPAQRRQGAGRALLLAALGVEGSSSIFTSTNASNWPMRGLLESLEWTLSGTLEGLDEGDSELVFFKRRKPYSRELKPTRTPP